MNCPQYIQSDCLKLLKTKQDQLIHLSKLRKIDSQSSDRKRRDFCLNKSTLNPIQFCQQNRQFQEQVKENQIDQQNSQILNRIIQITCRDQRSERQKNYSKYPKFHNESFHYSSNAPYLNHSLNEISKQKQTDRIYKENTILIKQICDSKPFINTSSLLKEFQQNQKRKEIICKLTDQKILQTKNYLSQNTKSTQEDLTLPTTSQNCLTNEKIAAVQSQNYLNSLNFISDRTFSPQNFYQTSAIRPPLPNINIGDIRLPHSVQNNRENQIKNEQRKLSTIADVRSNQSTQRDENQMDFQLGNGAGIAAAEYLSGNKTNQTNSAYNSINGKITEEEKTQSMKTFEIKNYQNYSGDRLSSIQQRTPASSLNSRQFVKGNISLAYEQYFKPIRAQNFTPLFSQEQSQTIYIRSIDSSNQGRKEQDKQNCMSMDNIDFNEVK